MKMRSVVVLAAAGGLALSACGSSDSDSDGSGGVVGSATSDASGQITDILGQGPPPAEAGDPPEIEAADPNTSDTLKVWLMPELPKEILTKVNDKFNESYPNAKVKVERQEWGSVQDRLTTALGTNATPDVAEIGNSWTAKFGDSGSLLDLTNALEDLNQSGWTEGLATSTELNGTVYAAPMYGAGRALVYNKEAWSKAGLSEAPTTLKEFESNLADLEKANSDKDFSAFWFPGKYWYAALPWIWGYGGDLAVQNGSTWTGAVDSQESQDGLTDLQGIVQKYSKAPVDATESVAGGGQPQAFNDGKAGTALMLPWEIAALDEGTYGLFALPNVDEGPAPQFLGGSNLTVSDASPRQGLALAWIEAYYDETIQEDYAKATQNIPAIAEAAKALSETDLGKVQQELAETGMFTPNSPQWANVEGKEVLPDMLVKIFAGAAADSDGDSDSESS